jgi:hypothetical protein
MPVRGSWHSGPALRGRGHTHPTEGACRFGARGTRAPLYGAGGTRTPPRAHGRSGLVAHGPRSTGLVCHMTPALGGCRAARTVSAPGRSASAPHPAGRNPAGPIRPAVLRSPDRPAAGSGRNHTDVTSWLPWPHRCHIVVVPVARGGPLARHRAAHKFTVASMVSVQPGEALAELMRSPLAEPGAHATPYENAVPHNLWLAEPPRWRPDGLVVLVCRRDGQAGRSGGTARRDGPAGRPGGTVRRDGARAGLGGRPARGRSRWPGRARRRRARPRRRCGRRLGRRRVPCR